MSAWSGGGQQRKGDVDRNIQEDTGGSSGRLIFADVSCINGRGLRFKADLLLFDPSPRLTRQSGIVCTQHPSALAGTGRWGGRGLGFVFCYQPCAKIKKVSVVAEVLEVQLEVRLQTKG